MLNVCGEGGQSEKRCRGIAMVSGRSVRTSVRSIVSVFRSCLVYKVEQRERERESLMGSIKSGCSLCISAT